MAMATPLGLWTYAPMPPHQGRNGEMYKTIDRNTRSVATWQWNNIYGWVCVNVEADYGMSVQHAMMMSQQQNTVVPEPQKPKHICHKDSKIERNSEYYKGVVKYHVSANQNLKSKLDGHTVTCQLDIINKSK